MQNKKRSGAALGGGVPIRSGRWTLLGLQVDGLSGHRDDVVGLEEDGSSVVAFEGIFQVDRVGFDDAFVFSEESDFIGERLWGESAGFHDGLHGGEGAVHGDGAGAEHFAIDVDARGGLEDCDCDLLHLELLAVGVEDFVLELAWGEAGGFEFTDEVEFDHASLGEDELAFAEVCGTREGDLDDIAFAEDAGVEGGWGLLGCGGCAGSLASAPESCEGDEEDAEAEGKRLVGFVHER